MGLACMLPEQGLKRCGCIPRKSGLTEICGTTPYMSPEMLEAKQPYTEIVDEWSCGVTMYVLLFAEFPYKTFNRDLDVMKDLIIKGRQNPSYKARGILPQPSPEACELVAALMTRDAERRPTAAEALSYSFLEQLVPQPDSDIAVPPVAPEVNKKVGSSVADESCTRAQLPSFHTTLLQAKTVLEEHEQRTPMDRKDSIEKALQALQKEQGKQWHRSWDRCSTEPSIRCDTLMQRLPTRLSTHSGYSGSSFSKLVEPCSENDSPPLPGTPSTVDSDSEKRLEL